VFFFVIVMVFVTVVLFVTSVLLDVYAFTSRGDGESERLSRRANATAVEA
jgi:hypothetical protein